MFKWFKYRYTREMRLKNCEERIILLQKEIDYMKTILHYREPWPPWGTNGVEMKEAVEAILNHLQMDVKVKMAGRRVVLEPWDKKLWCNIIPKAGPDTNVDLPECPIKPKEKV